MEVVPGRKIGEIVQTAIAAAEENGTVPYSFEYFPPKTAEGVENLYNRLWRMGKWGPQFVDFTWGAGGSTSELTLDLSTNAKTSFGLDVNMHLTCTNMEMEKVYHALKHCRANGIRNICALRGDPPVGQEWKAIEGGFTCALDLIRFIRKEHGDWFGISCAGYPEGHPNRISAMPADHVFSPTELARRTIDKAGVYHVCTDADYAKEITYLKEKVDAGADVIITQLFFSVDVFMHFVRECRAAGIMVPILPGIMPISSYGGFHRMTGFCKTFVPAFILEDLEKIKGDDAAVKAYGAATIGALCKQLLDTKEVKFLHFYTLNTEPATQDILAAIGIAVPSKESLPAEEAAEIAALSKRLATPAEEAASPAAADVKSP